MAKCKCLLVIVNIIRTVTAPYLVHSTSGWPESSFDDLTSLLDELRAAPPQRKY